MSHVHNFILTFNIMENCSGRVESINRITPTQPFQEVDYRSGYKCLEVPIYVAAINYTDWHKLVDAIVSQPWQNPEDVRLWVCRQDDEIFTQYSLEELKNIPELR